MRRVVVTGIGIVSPFGVGRRVFWEQLLAGTVALRRLDLLDSSGFACQLAGQTPPYKIGDYVPKSYRKATKVMARDIELAVIAAHDAFADAGLQSKASIEPPGFEPARFGCNIGAGLISAELDELTAAMHVARAGDRLDLKKWGSEGMGQLTPLWLLKYLPNMLACHVTIIHGLMGPSNTITCEAASSHLAIGEAFRTIQRGKADLAICGGAESRLNPMGIMRQSLLGRLNADGNDRPADAVRPFDEDARGTVLGEGGGLLILEELEHARARGATIHAEIVGFAASQDCYRITEPDPSGHSYGNALANALRDARLAPADVDVLVPHGLGIRGFDRAELNGIRRALGEHASRVALSPIKAQVGHLVAGCGVDAAAAVLAVAEGKIPPAVNTRKWIDGTPLNVDPVTRERPVGVAATSVYSLGGQNAALVFRRL